MDNPEMSDDERGDIQERIDSIAWYHEFEFPDGFVARSEYDGAEHRRTWDFIRENLNGIDFSAKSVLDLGCWDGYWSFYAEQRGAQRVLATDDLSQNWAGSDGLLLARELLKSSIEVKLDVSVYDLTPLMGESFDIILCLGVYYHLVDPFYAFSQIRKLCHKDTLVIFEGDTATGQRSRQIYWDLQDQTLPIFVPHPQCLAQMLNANYFDIVSQASIVHRWDSRLRENVSQVRRMVWQQKFRGLPRWLNRTITVCRPMHGDNGLIHYRPPFGLSEFDARFSSSE
jgi:tRNA (mo5U34)-methyltransferase